jgi:hypothetical protein
MVTSRFWDTCRMRTPCLLTKPLLLLLLLLVLGLVARGSEARMRRLHVDANVRD